MTRSIPSLAFGLLLVSTALSPALAVMPPSPRPGNIPLASQILARVQVAQADRTAPAADPQASGARTDGVRQSSQTQVGSRQPTGAFPTNEISRQPVIDLGAGEDGMKKDVAALQQTLTELQQLQLQTKQAHWNASGTLYYPLHLLLQEHTRGCRNMPTPSPSGCSPSAPRRTGGPTPS